MEFSTVAQPSRRKQQNRLGKKLQKTDELFSSLPGKHKAPEVYRVIARASGLSEDSIAKYCSRSLSLIEGARHGA